jgi:hypothetical protein
MLKNILRAFLVLDLIVINAVVWHLFTRPQTTVSGDFQENQFQSPTTETVDVCGTDCQNQIDLKLKAYDKRIENLEESQGITPAPTAKPVYLQKPASRTKIRSVQYVTIPGTGSTMANIWQDISGTDFYFDPGDYPGLAEIYFEASMKLYNGNGMANIRLFDVTHGIGVQGSEVSTNSQIEAISVSGRVSFWAGRNLIRVQAKSLTADTTIYSYGRLKVVTEN